MGRHHGNLFGYRIYRRKFWGTVVVMLLMSTAVFLGMTAFFVNTWVTTLGNEAQSRFLAREPQLADIQGWAMEYVNGLYGNERLMEDLSALFAAQDEREYIRLRQQNSLGSASQIRYIPADIKNSLFYSRNKINSVVLRSDSGKKTIWLQSMDACLFFDEDVGEENRFGDILAAVCSVRDPLYMGQTMGTMEFWVSSRDIYGTDQDIRVAWKILEEDGSVLWDRDERLASGRERRQSVLCAAGIRFQRPPLCCGQGYCLCHVGQSLCPVDAVWGSDADQWRHPLEQLCRDPVRRSFPVSDSGNALGSGGRKL